MFWFENLGWFIVPPKLFCSPMAMTGCIPVGNTSI